MTQIPAQVQSCFRLSSESTQFQDTKQLQKEIIRTNGKKANFLVSYRDS